MLNPEELRTLPKVTLHDHLDGELRPAIVVEHCVENGHKLPTTDPEKLGRWFPESTDSGSLMRYLEDFAYATAAMQTRNQFVQVACEFVLDQTAGGVVYAEARWVSEQHLEEDLTPEAVVEAVRDGLAEGMVQAEAVERAIVVTQIVTAMRHVDEPTTDITGLALAYRDDSVVEYDITSAEMGSRPARFQTSFDLLRRNNAHFTTHAGGADGLKPMWEAVQPCGAQRIGHDVRVCEDIEDFWKDQPGLGWFAAFIRDQQVPSEMCPTSNLQTGVARSLDRHPVGRLAGLGFNAVIHCDNHLMSGTFLSGEFAKLSETFGWGPAEVEAATVAATRAASPYHDEQEVPVEGLVRPAFHAARREAQA